MFSRLETLYAGASPLQRMLMLWTIAGAVVHAAVPALHSAITPIGPIALWLWVLPLAALALELFAAPPTRMTSIISMAASATPIARRRRAAVPVPRAPVSRRDRPRSPAKGTPAAPRVRRAG